MSRRNLFPIGTLVFKVQVLIFVLLHNAAFSQAPGTVNGRIIDENGDAIAGITIRLENTNLGNITDAQGLFEIASVPEGDYTMIISGVGFKEERQTIKVLSGQSTFIKTILKEGIGELGEVIVIGKTENQASGQRAIKAEVIDAKQAYVQPATTIELMNRTVGIRVRQTGGLGSNASIMLNGFQGRAIKYFKDGIPMDYLGAGYNFALVPVNMLERIEVYKGVLPTGLGADALGGGLNMISRKSLDKYVAISYEIASFNTHRGSANLYYKNTEKKYFIGGDAFVNHSDNDYEVMASVIDSELGTQSNKEVKLFHNKFTHYFAEAYAGFIDTKWADELRIGLTGFTISKENQYGSRMTKPFGASTSYQYSIIPTLRYKKSLLNNRISVDQFFVMNTVHVELVDTARGTYDWYGNFTPSPDASKIGEISERGSYAKNQFSYLTSRTNIGFNITNTQKLEFNLVYSKVGREGSDPFGLKFKSGKDILSVPARYDKFVLAAGLESKLFNEKLSNSFIVKFFNYKTNATDADYYGGELDRSVQKERWGIAEAVKFIINEKSYLRVSGEISTRLPEQDELFGDGNFHVSNLDLKPERSTNFNIGYRIEKNEKYAFEVNTFYRITKDLILNVPYNFIFNRHENVNDVKGLGLETDVNISVLKWLKANGNFTYQDLRLFKTGNSATEGARLRNTPFFFANVGLNATHSSLISRNDKVQIYWYYTFLREYYLDYIPKAMEPEGFLGLWGKAAFDAPNIIPDQHLNTIGFTYYPFDEKVSAGLQVKNIFDKSVYDNFRVQNAGRSIHLKINYTF